MDDPQYIIGNSKDLISHFETNKLKPNLIITSPPYYDVLNYNNHKEQMGHGQSYEDYLNDVADILQKCYLISTENSSLWIVVDTFKKGKDLKVLPFDILSNLKQKNNVTWNLKDIIIWDKQKNLPWGQTGNFKNQFEYILFLTKSNSFQFYIDELREINDLKKWWKTYPERYNPDGKAPSNLWSFTTPLRGWGENKQNHLCPFPFDLVEKIISLCSKPGDVIFDPFAGSGSVLAIAKEMKRKSWGIDINKQYKKIFEKEVLSGASLYWNRKQIQLEKNKDLLKNFSETNLKLRKLKTANILLKYFNQKKGKTHFLTVLDTSKNENKISLIFKPALNKNDLKINDEDILGFLKQAKISFELTEVDDYSLLKGKFYKYGIDRFYSFTSSCQIKDMVKREDNGTFFYSNIQIKIFEN